METQVPPSEPQDITAAEVAAQTRLEPELRRHLNLAGSAFNLISGLVSVLPTPFPDEGGQAIRAVVLLSLRLSNDLRGTQVVAARGYPAQALSLVASMYEVAHAIGYIGNDEGLAQQWLDHDDPTRSFRSAYCLTLGCLRRLGAADLEERATHHYKRYSQLCWGKHAWPKLEVALTVQRQGDQYVPRYGPNDTDDAVRAAWFALENAAWCAHVGMDSLIQCHIGGGLYGPLAEQMKQLAQEYESLRNAFLARWPTDDPFPDRWRDFGER